MNNPRITKKERGLLKGAIRRVFSRSDLRRSVVEKSQVKGVVNAKRPRVKKWSKCSLCKELIATYQIVVDHIDPIIAVNGSLENMDWDEVINKTWCVIDNLQAICLICHGKKTIIENMSRRNFKKTNK